MGVSRLPSGSKHEQRGHNKVFSYLERAHREGVQVLIGCDGLAAHLAGVVARHTRLLVIGLPLSNGLLSGLDSLCQRCRCLRECRLPPWPSTVRVMPL